MEKFTKKTGEQAMICFNAEMALFIGTLKLYKPYNHTLILLK